MALVLFPLFAHAAGDVVVLIHESAGEKFRRQVDHLKWKAKDRVRKVAEHLQTHYLDTRGMPEAREVHRLDGHVWSMKCDPETGQASVSFYKGMKESSKYFQITAPKDLLRGPFPAPKKVEFDRVTGTFRDASSGEAVSEVRFKEVEDHAVSADGKWGAITVRIGTRSGFDGKLPTKTHIVNIATGEKNAELGEREGRLLRVSPDGETLLWRDYKNQKVSLLDAKTGAKRMPDFDAEVFTSGFSRDGKLFYFGDLESHTLQLFSMPEGTRVYDIQVPNLWGAATSVDGEQLHITDKAGNLFLFDVRTGSQLAYFGLHALPEFEARALECGSGRILLTGGGTGGLVVWDKAKVLGADVNEPKVFKDLWKDLGDADGVIAQRALWNLLLRPELAPQLKAAVANIKEPSPVSDATALHENVKTAIKQLAANDYPTRQSGADFLKQTCESLPLSQLRELLQPQIAAALEKERDPGAKAHLEGLKQRLDRTAFTSFSTRPDELRKARAALVIKAFDSQR